jgi:hypothetical protein
MQLAAQDLPSNDGKQEVINPSSPSEVILFCGNPGVGKSSLCNSIFQKKAFESGISLGTGLTREKQEYIYENRKYIDTPGLSDINLRKQAAEEIEKALKENNNYKIIFVATLEAGRIKSDDLVTINTVCKAIKVPFEYGIIFNKVTNPVIKKINETGLVSYLSSLHKQPLSTIVIKFEGEMHDADNEYLSSGSENREKLVSFITSLKANMILANNVQHIDVGAYEALVIKMETKLAEALKKAEEEREKHKKEIADQAVKINTIGFQLQTVLTKAEEERIVHQKLIEQAKQAEAVRIKTVEMRQAEIEKENQRLAQEVRSTENAIREAEALAARQSETLKKLQEDKLAQEIAYKKLKEEREGQKDFKRVISEADINALVMQAREGNAYALQKLLDAADQGVASAQTNLGFMYKNGYGGVKQNYKQAAAWFQKAADQGDATALGVMYANGYGVKQDYKQAAAWYQKAADQGVAAAQNNLGVMYQNGDGVNKDYKQAVAWYEKAADQGDAAAQNNLGVMYKNGYGVNKDYKQAAAWFQKAADQGVAAAQNNLGVMYQNGDGVNKDYKQAVAWYQKAADQEYAAAQKNLGVMYAKGDGVNKDYKQAVAWYEKAADQGDAAAQNNLGVMYDNGDGVNKDSKQAVAWFQKAADQGFAAAQNNLGVMYDNGDGVNKDYKQAFAWYEKAADQGYAAAQNNLGVMYDNGDGVNKDYKQAFAWYQKAADQGYADAQYNLGFMYYNGYGVNKDYKQAVAWYQKAADQGDVDAKRRLEELFIS